MNIVLIVLSVLVVFCLLFGLYVPLVNKLAKDRYSRYKKTPWTRGFIRTPDERFHNLPGYDFEPHYIEIDGLRIHYVDEGPRDGEVVLLMHGEPTWSYLYRRMIVPIRDAGYRVIAPDLAGFGRSDKLISRLDYTYQMHVDMMNRFVRDLGLSGITLFCQDWGGLIGLRVVADNTDRFARVAVSNTSLPGLTPPIPPDNSRPLILPLRSFAGFIGWLAFSQLVPRLKAGTVLRIGTAIRPAGEVVAAYDAPFPDSMYVAGARMFPVLVPSQFKECTEAWKKLAAFNKPFITLFGDRDPVLGGGDKVFQKVVPGAKGQKHATVKNASHFSREDQGEELASHLLAFMRQTGQGG